MAKNDWRGNDVAKTEVMNQPFFLASGAKSGGNVLVSVTPGSIRWPHLDTITYSGQPQQLTIPATANDRFAIFVRAGGAFMVSGTTVARPVSQTTNVGTPGPPRWDAEYIGEINVGAFTASSDITGPWNQGADGPFEPRGQMSASSRPRIVYNRVTTPATIDGDVALSPATSSGIIWLSMDDSRLSARAENANDFAPGTMLQATVEWAASGITVGGVLRTRAGFAFQRGEDLNSPDNVFGRVEDTIHSTVALDPFNDGVKVHRTTALADINSIVATTRGYVLLAWTQQSSNTADFLLRRAYMQVMPGQYVSRNKERS